MDATLPLFALTSQATRGWRPWQKAWRSETSYSLMSAIDYSRRQAVYKSYYDRRHRDVRHVVGDWVWLRLRQRAASSLNLPTRGKLKPRFYGPYRISEVVNDVAYRLELPVRSRLHDVFHVGLLKKFFGMPPTAPPGLPPIHNSAAVPEPERVTRSRLARGVR